MKRFLPVLVVLAVVGCSDPEPKKDDKDAETSEPVDFGTVKIELDVAKAPITAKNFLQYVDDKHYDGTIFHRVMPGFMIQGGHFTKGFAKAKTYEEGEALGKKSRATIKNESKNGLLNKRGTLAMARTNAPDSASDQFFINLVDNAPLDRANSRDGVGYAVFAKVIDGMDVVDKIAKVKTMTPSPAGHEAVPIKDVIIESIVREPTEEGKNPVVVMTVKGRS